jgi:NAD(P)H-hydrate repair Nnr-like enzyme with NAD(P)H-hydrate dehydratase domain
MSDDSKIQTQTKDRPLFPDFIWSRPENKQHAGKLLIIGGNKFGFSLPAESYNEAEKAGAGSLRVIMPDSLKSIVSKIFPSADFVSSNPSGGFSQGAIAEISDQILWANATLLAGDFGHNSETAIVIEKILSSKSPLILSGDSLDSFLTNPRHLMSRENTLIVTNFSKLQKITTSLRLLKPLTMNMPLKLMNEAISEFTSKFPTAIILIHKDNVYMSYKGRVSVTGITKDANIETKVASHASVWFMQNPNKVFESITCSVIDFAI